MLRTLIIALCVILILGGRLAYLQLVDGHSLSSAAALERTAHTVLPPERGDILDRTGHPLALDIKADAIYAVPRLIKHPAAEARTLAPILHLPEATVQKDLTGTSWFHWIQQGVTLSEGKSIEQLKLIGINEQLENWRSYPDGNLAGQVIGFVGENQQGLAGLEYSYNKQLQGHQGSQTYTTDALGNAIPSFSQSTTPSTAGDSLQLTLSAAIQSFAQADLNAAMKKTKSQTGRILVMDPESGAILAMAQSPSPNPATWQNEPMADFTNQATQNVYPPGSTFKPVTASAALATGTINMSTIFNDPGYKVITGVMLHGWEYPGHFGKITLGKAIEESSDIAFMDIGLKLGVTRFYDYLKTFHLTKPSGIRLPAEAQSIIQPENTVRPLDLATMAFGQTLSITPLQLVSAIAAIADGGIWHQPYIVKNTITPAGKTIAHINRGQRIIPKWVAQDVISSMERVVERKHGTGVKAAIAGYTLAGKTGTAQLPGSHGRLVPGRYMSSFIAYGPLPHPRFLILVQLNRPKGQYYGGAIAAPVVKTLFTQVLHYEGITPSTANGSQPPHTIKLPLLDGQSVTAAVDKVLRLGLTPHIVGTGTRIIRQSPVPSATVALGSSITLTTNKSSAKTVVPDVLGLSLRDAVAQLTSQGYTFSAHGSGVVQSQSPAPGHAPPSSKHIDLKLANP